MFNIFETENKHEVEVKNTDFCLNGITHEPTRSKQTLPIQCIPLPKVMFSLCQFTGGGGGGPQHLTPSPFPPSDPRSFFGGVYPRIWVSLSARMGITTPSPGQKRVSVCYIASGTPLAVFRKRAGGLSCSN